MIRIQNTGVFIILLRIFEILETDQDFNHPHQSHLYPGKCRNVRHSHLGKRQKDKKYLNRSRGSQARWELAAFPHKSPSIADYIIVVHFFTQIWFIKVVFFLHANTIWIRNTQYHSLSDSNPKNIIYWALHGVCLQSKSSKQSRNEMAAAPTEHYWFWPPVYHQYLW